MSPFKVDVRVWDALERRVDEFYACTAKQGHDREESDVEIMSSSFGNEENSDVFSSVISSNDINSINNKENNGISSSSSNDDDDDNNNNNNNNNKENHGISSSSSSNDDNNINIHNNSENNQNNNEGFDDAKTRQVQVHADVALDLDGVYTWDDLTVSLYVYV